MEETPAMEFKQLGDVLSANIKALVATMDDLCARVRDLERKALAAKGLTDGTLINEGTKTEGVPNTVGTVDTAAGDPFPKVAHVHVSDAEKDEERRRKAKAAKAKKEEKPAEPVKPAEPAVDYALEARTALMRLARVNRARARSVLESFGADHFSQVLETHKDKMQDVVKAFNKALEEEGC